jgi:hypothetical protein
VLRGWAVVLDLDLRETETGGLQLQPDMPGYRRHFIDLRGLGVRDLVWDGDDLLILAGPTMDLDGPVRVLRWRRAADAAADSVLPANQIEPVLEVPFGDGSDHAEGIAFVGPRELLVLYDSPADWRLAEGDSRIVADLFDIAP